MTNEIEQKPTTNSLLLLKAFDGFAGDVILRLVSELAKVFDGHTELEAIHYRNRHGQLSEKSINFPVYRLEINQTIWSIWLWEIHQHGIFEFSTFDFRTSFKGFICLLLDPLCIENDTIRSIVIQDQSRNVNSIFYLFSHPPDPLNFPIFLLQVYGKAGITSLINTIGEAAYENLPTDTFYMQCPLEDLHKFPEMLQDFLSGSQ
ncbi:MAG: hypothetical protein ABI690_15350 [Chloroflexota bacterium]